MIDFHKKTGIPGPVQPGHEDVWFSTTGLYVSDNDGNPRMISAATQVGELTPVGVPEVPNMIYFNVKTRKHYIASDQRWVEIPTAAIPGSGGTGGNAGNVMVNDAGNWYTSNDVEGVLNEIGEAIPYLFGSKTLPTYGQNVLDINTSNEYFIANAAQNKPSGAISGWNITRKNEDGDILGLYVDKSNKLFTNVNGTFVKIAAQYEMDQALDVVNTSLQQTISTVEKTLASYKIKDMTAGRYVNLVKQPDGTYFLGLDTMASSLLDTLAGGAQFVKKVGDVMTGNLTIRSGSESAVLVEDGDMNTYGGLFASSTGFGLYDYKRMRGFIKKDDTGRFLIEGHGGESEIRTESTIRLSSTASDSSDDAVIISRRQSNGASLIIEGNGGRMRLGYSTELKNNFLTTSSNIYIRKIGGGSIPWFKVEAAFLHSIGRMSSTMGVFIGADEYGDPVAGEAKANRKLYLYPYAHNGTKKERSQYGAIGFNATADEIRMFVSTRDKDDIQYVNVKAKSFINASSIKYKDVHGKFEETVLPTIMGVSPYTYNFKGVPETTELGFIVERGMPKEVVNGDGINSYALVAYLWKGVQELAEKVEYLEKQLRK